MLGEGFDQRGGAALVDTGPGDEGHTPTPRTELGQRRPFLRDLPQCPAGSKISLQVDQQSSPGRQCKTETAQHRKSRVWRLDSEHPFDTHPLHMANL
jgi:hypothetical protein